MAVLHARAQDAASPKFTLFAGPGMLATQGISKGEFQAGVSLDEAPPNSWGGFLLEVGYIGPFAGVGSGSALFSADYMAAWHFGPTAEGRTKTGATWWRDRGWKFLPFACAGYTRLFGTGNAVNFGSGFDYRLNHSSAIRAEIRDYFVFSKPKEQDIGLRLGYVIYLSD